MESQTVQTAANVNEWHDFRTIPESCARLDSVPSFQGALP